MTTGRNGRNRRTPGNSIMALPDSELQKLLELYRHLHSHPELSGNEGETARTLTAKLEELGFQVTRNVGGHGIVGVFRNGEGPTIGIRMDLDALPITESTGISYASGVRSRDSDGSETGVMHACGHDIHMTVAVGTAGILVRNLRQWSGTVVVIGQASEETGTGAEAMIEDGLFTRFPRPDCILALHVSPPIPAGVVAYSEGEAMAGCASLEVRIRGTGGHGSRPHEAKDPVVMAAETVLLLQKVVSREIDPREPAVLSIGSIHGGTRSNIIPEEVVLKVNYRYFKSEVDRHLDSAVRRICRGVAVAAGLPDERMPTVTTVMTGPPVINDPELARRVAAVFREALGEEHVLEKDAWTASDDFAHFGLVEPRIPLFYFWLGVTDPGEIERCDRENRPIPGIHNSAFAPLPGPSIRTGTVAMASAVLSLMKN